MAQVPSHVDVSEPLGARPLAQVAVYPIGAHWAMISRRRGPMIARLALGRQPDSDRAQTPCFRVSHSAARILPGAPGAGPVVRVPVAKSGAILAVTTAELALVGYELHGASLTAGQVILRVPRSEVKTALLGRGRPGIRGTAPRPLTIVLVNGDTWRLEVFRIDEKRAEAVFQALAADDPPPEPPSGSD